MTFWNWRRGAASHATSGNNAVANFRSSEIYRRHLGRMSDFLDHFDAQTLDEVVRGG